MKKSICVGLIVLFLFLGFFVGFFLNQPQEFSSCKSAYDGLLNSEICEGKFEDSYPMGYYDFEKVESLELFNYSRWSQGELKLFISDISQNCRFQANEQFIETGKRDNLISCFADEVSIENGILNIQCGCFFG